MTSLGKRSRTLRILVALPGMHRVVRGAEVAFESIAQRVAATNGFDVTVIGSGPSNSSRPYRYLQSSCIGREHFERFPSLPYLRDHYGYEELSFAPGLYQLLRQHEFDVTVTCGYPYTNWVLRSQAARHVFVTQNGDWMLRCRKWEYRFFDCDALVCTNPDYFDAHRGRWPSVLIPNGVDPEMFRPGASARQSLGLPGGRPVILMVSALASFKRVLEGIRAAARVPDAYLVIAGDGEQRQNVLALGNELMPGRFRLMSLSRQQMPSLYRSADVFLHMSQDEPSANAYIEALASGLPIVTHDRRVTRWTMEDMAVLVDTSIEDEVVAGIERALTMHDDEDVRARRDLVNRRFSWDAIAMQYCEFFQKVADER